MAHCMPMAGCLCPAGCVNTVHFSPDGQLLVSGSDDMQIIFWYVGNVRRFQGTSLAVCRNACLPPPLCRDWQLGTRALEFHSGEGGSNRRADRLTGWWAMCRRTLSRTGPWRCRPPQQRVPSPGHAPVSQRHRGDLRSRRHGEGSRHPPGMWRCSGGDQAAGLPSWASSQAVAGTGQPSLLPVLW